MLKYNFLKKNFELIHPLFGGKFINWYTEENKLQFWQNICLAELVKSVMSATDTPGHQDVHGLYVVDPHPRQWISIRTIPKDVGMLL